jgi:hypothetical protein
VTDGRLLQLRREKLQWLELEGEVVALDEEAFSYLGANRSGALLWSLLARGTTRAQLVAALTARFGIDELRAAGDVDAFLAALAGHGLLEAA